MVLNTVLVNVGEILYQLPGDSRLSSYTSSTVQLRKTFPVGTIDSGFLQPSYNTVFFFDLALLVHIAELVSGMELS